MAKKTSLLDIELPYFDLLSNMFGGTMFFVLLFFAQNKICEKLQFLLTGEINEFVFVLISIPIVYAVGMLLHSISSFISWIFNQDKVLEWYFNNKIGKFVFCIFTTHLLIGQSYRLLYNNNEKENECTFETFKTKVRFFQNQTGGLSNFFARASFVEVVFISSLIAIITYWVLNGFLCCFSINFLILLLVMLSSYIQSISYWSRFVKSKLRSIERKENKSK
ncbi:MAG: hypothetical protein IKP08_06930 [Bacteroidales bacterium]|nr:hypothetical protein [Bacteroidales bacterium]